MNSSGDQIENADKKIKLIKGENEKEELISVENRFLNDEKDDHIKDVKEYINNEKSYINRLNTYNKWINKPVHLCSLILARNGFVCKNESTIECEICQCKYIYEKGTYSMYTRINDLCLLHTDNCLWKNKLIDLSFFKLDSNSLDRVELLSEYKNNCEILKRSLLYIPMINIKKTINDIILVIKKHVQNDKTKKKFTIFNSYLDFFKNNFIPIFLKNENIIQKSIDYIKKNYKDMEKYIVDSDYIKNLNFNLFNVNNFINILSDTSAAPELENEKEDINAYIKIMHYLRKYEYDDINLFKVISLLGWTCKDEIKNNSKEQIISCKYCYREVNISDYSYFSLNDKKYNLFIEVDSNDMDYFLSDPSNNKSMNQDKNEKATNIILDKILTIVNGHFDEEGEIIYDEIEKQLYKNVNKEDKDKSIDISKNENKIVVDAEKIEPINEKENVSEEKENKNENEIKHKESFSFKSTLKGIFLSKKTNDNLKEYKSNDNGLEGENGKNNIEIKDNDDEKNENKIEQASSLNEAMLKLCKYTDDDKYFLKGKSNYYILKEFIQENLDDNQIKKQKITKEQEKREKITNKIYAIRLFNLIENHRVYCPYVMEDLYGFSKITKLFFELLISEFQRMYMFK
ncbi:zinc finger protein, putative [Plasmodium berghei]|uniref:Zinc finger protein, putative n=2 Tax=Plasmodium berghei TaxID=5821 RepID=A0A509AQQ8_PLABA|nr:zinc finger protein, putative [Plasmodium berghei ANKA]CXI81407.1 zinc finger protein, putative [Plasmodium berghei]SCM25507.1 zinc finger protein, putative [Plasmodium berghei]SCN27388.1 zinc finger protein, putative [Plasmodium berghei]SCO62055.1 zinc finger protein, putative [Plasmodium berghei]SCO63814.1 zinc finger protein, putative [Plasmodium berghei]|eukprot:XP_034423021.1 zinc finger protein, putative [Plasmodium berghei ANKA]